MGEGISSFVLYFFRDRVVGFWFYFLDWVFILLIVLGRFMEDFRFNILFLGRK